MNGWRRILGVAFCGALCGALPLSAGESIARPDPTNERAGVAQLLDSGAKPSAKSLEAARRIYGQLAQQTTHRGRVDYAFALALVRQGRYEEASELLAQVAAEQSGRLSVLALRLRVWSLTAAGNFEDAMDEAAGLAELVAHDPVASGRQFWIETAERIGHVTAYAAGQGRGVLSGDSLQRYERRIRDALPEYALAGFERAIAATAQRYAALEDEYQRAEAETKDRHSDKVETALDEIKSSSEQINTEWASLEEKSEKRGERSWNEVAGIEAKIAEVATLFNRIDAQNRALKLEVFRLDQQNQQTIRESQQGRHISEAERHQVSIFSNRHRMERLEAQIAVFETQLATLKARAIVLGRQRAQALARQQSESRRLEGKQAELVDDAKILANKRKLLERRQPGHSAKMLELKKRMESLSTYAELPFEQEKERILASYDAERKRR
jgi:hypothetical protein